jgi:hypothetical protein
MNKKTTPAAAVKPSITDFMKPEPVAPVAEKPAKPSSEEIVNITFRLPRSQWAKLSNLATNERSSLQQLLLAALKADFERRGLPF